MDTIFEQDIYMMTFINGLEHGGQTFALGVDIPTRVYKASFEKDEKDNFVLKFSLPEGEDFNPDYFFTRPAVLSVPGHIQIILLNSDAISFTQSLNETGPSKVEVVYKSFATEIDPAKWEGSKHCAYYRYSKKDFHYTDMSLNYDFTTHKDQYSTWRNGFLVQLPGKADVLVSFEETTEGDDAYCIFRSQNKIDSHTFEGIIEATRLLFGLLSGYCLADRAYFLSDYTTEKPKDRTPLIIRYKNDAQHLKHRYPVLDKSHYEDLDRTELKINTCVFNNLVRLVVNNEDYMRAIRLLIDASATDGPSRGVLAVVALESIANQLVRKGPMAKVVTDKDVARQLDYELNKGLKKIKGKVLPGAYEKLESKVKAVNNLPNAVKLESVFDQLGIELDEEEQYCISCRNRFLHGALPKSIEFPALTDDEVVFMVSQRIIMLTSMLILKKAGYGGQVIDWGFTEVMKRRAIRDGKPLKHIGNAHRTV